MNNFKYKTLLLIFYIFGSFNLYSQSGTNTWECIDTNGKTIFSIKAYSITDFSDGYAKIYQQNLINNKWISGFGFIDGNGKVVIECKYYSAHKFVDGLVWVQEEKGGVYKLLDKKGNEIPTKGYKKVASMVKGKSSRIAVYNDEGAMGFIDRNGKEVIPCQYYGSTYFEEGLTCVTHYNQKEEIYGFIDTTGAVIIPFKLKQGGTTRFNKDGISRGAYEGKIALIDKKGNLFFKTKYRSLQDLNYGLVAACTNSDRTGWGFLNLKDEFVIPPIYDYASDFNEDGLALVKKDGLEGVIDTTGKIVIPIKYETVFYNFSKNGFYGGIMPSEKSLSLLDSENIYFDKNFEIIPFEGRVMTSANYGNRIVFCSQDKLYGYLNLNYEIVIPAIYKKASIFHEGKAWVLLP